jgi:hypothetical protein
MDAVKKVFSDATEKQEITAILMLLVTFVLVIYISFWLFKQFTSNNLQTSTVANDKPVAITGKQMVNLTSNVSLPSQQNGKEYSMSFWIYLSSDSAESTSEPKFVIGRGTSKTAVASHTPLFYMDPNVNKMHLVMKNTNSGNFSTLSQLHASQPRMLTIDYMPFQRWVNVIAVVDQNYVQLFMDGELRQVDDLSTATRSQVVSDSSGDIYVGGDSSVMSIKGYVSKVQWLNYAVTIDHAKIIYRAGPLRKTILSSIGLPMYGLRSPFVRIDKEVSSDCELNE